MNTIKDIKGPVIFVLCLLFSLAIMFSFKYIVWIPIINNLLLGINFLIVFSLSIWILIFLKKIKAREKVEKFLKIIVIISFFLLSTIIVFFLILFSVFAGKSNNKIEFKNQVYYYQDEGFLDTYYVFYRKKSFFTMEKLYSYNYLPELNEKNLEALIKGNYEKEKIKSKKPNENKKPIKKEIKPLSLTEREELINKYKGPEYINKIKDSNYVIISVDKAMHQNLYYFGLEEGEKIKYISELPENSAFLDGLIEDEVIKLTFKDTNGKLYKYKSINDGISWEIEE